MKATKWMLYGATGYTGNLIAEEAVRRGHRPVLAGRTEAKLRPLAQRLGLDYLVARLDQLEGLLADVDLLLHCAGPFSTTAPPVVRACLSTGTHYLDIAGEFDVFEAVFSYDQAARAAGIALIPGVGFAVVATDCLARYLADQKPRASTLELGIDAMRVPSPGTYKSQLEYLTSGQHLSVVRRAGKLVPQPVGEVIRIPFPHAELAATPLLWSDLTTAYRSTGIPNITIYVVQSEQAIRQMRRTFPIMQKLLKVTPLRHLIQKWIEWRVTGPDQAFLDSAGSHVWGRVADSSGSAAEAWLETPESYRVTAVGSLHAVERVLGGHYTGALTPAQAFGPDFVLEIPGTRRLNALP